MRIAPSLLEREVTIACLRDELALRKERDWLSAPEMDVWQHLAGRTGAVAWLAGRYLGKSLVAELLVRSGATDIELHEVAILSTDGRGRRNRPQVFWQGRRLDLRLSLAHSQRFVYAAVGKESGAPFGVDVADREELDRSFQATWFSAAEQAAVLSGDPILTALRIWTAKEACYKACQHGEAFDPKRCEVRPAAEDAGEVTYQGTPRQRCRVHWAGGAERVCALAVLEEASHD